MSKRHILTIVAVLVTATSASAADPYQGEYVVPEESPPMVQEAPPTVVAPPAVIYAPPPVYVVPQRYYVPPPVLVYRPRPYNRAYYRPYRRW
jgi:hypothetical protein